MKDIPRFAAILTLVALIAAGSLAWINDLTRPNILAQQAKELNDGLGFVLPGATGGVIEPVMKGETICYYKGFADQEKTQLSGIAFQVFAKGYSSTINTLVGIDTAGVIRSIKVIYQQETPGLGTRCQEVKSGDTLPWWQTQFNGLLATDVAVDKDGGRIESITGATITSRAITDAIADSAQSIMTILQNQL